MSNSKLKAAIIFFLVLLNSAVAFAQSRVSPNWGLGEADDIKNEDVSHPLEMFKGWTLLYKGYSKSPIIFDSIMDGKTRKYPTIGSGEQSKITQAQDTLKVL